MLFRALFERALVGSTGAARFFPLDDSGRIVVAGVSISDAGDDRAETDDSLIVKSDCDYIVAENNSSIASLDDGAVKEFAISSSAIHGGAGILTRSLFELPDFSIFLRKVIP